MRDEATLETINHFFKVQGIYTYRCHEPSEKCQRTSIRAHSIPNSSVLERLADDGHVVMLQMRLRVPPPAEVDFRRVGINRATTFTGLCSQHDTELFRPIDTGVPDLADRSHLFLLAYRAVLREFHVCLQNAWRFQSVYQKRVEVGLSPGTEPCSYGELAVGHLANFVECYEYKRQFDQYYLRSDWSQLRHYTIVLKGQWPTVAVSSLFSLDDVVAPETPRVTLSVFPANEDAIVVFSAVPNDAPLVETYLNRILSSAGHFQKYLLSKLILQSCENVVIAPKYFDGMTQDRKAAICQFFVGTVAKNADEHEDERLYLF